MKTLVFSFLALAAVALAGYQHQQLGQLRAENTALQQSASEANQLQTDLAKSTGDAAQSEEEIARLREENHDLLKLRGEVSELRDARAEFERVSAENKRLQSAVASTRATNANQPFKQPITIRMSELYDRGLSTPDFAVQTFFWAARNGNLDAFSHCMMDPSRRWENSLKEMQREFQQLVAIVIIGQRQIDANTIEVGIQLNLTPNFQEADRRRTRVAVRLVLRNGDWKQEGNEFF
ncbi:MAG TPA: hypothetical protein VN873_16230 [Candidatus Angelobacter sp.]|nr:hypothetical protein [Candidatus Angelobacter sp.]